MCDIRAQDKEEYRRFLNEIGEEYCEASHYCIFKEFLVAAHPSRRLLVQLKLVDKRKYEQSQKAGKDVGWGEALQSWLKDGCAEDFQECYSDERSVREILRMMHQRRWQISVQTQPKGDSQ